MPRKAGARWHKGKKRWYANIGEVDSKGRATEVYAPETIGEKDEGAAWEWLKTERARRDNVVPVVIENSVDWVFERYLKWYEDRVKEGKHSITEQRNKQRHLGMFCDVFGTRPVPSVSPEEVTAFGEDLLSDYSPVYARNVCASARAAFNWAAKAPQRLIADNPIRGYRAPMIPRSPERHAETIEAAAFIGYWRTRTPRTYTLSRYERLTILLERCLINTGCRPKELCRLKWEDIKWNAWQTPAGHSAAKAIIPYRRWKAGKVTGKPRTIYFSPLLSRALRRVFDRTPPNSEWVFVHHGGFAGRGMNEPWEDGSTLSITVKRIRTELIARQESIRERIRGGEDVRSAERKLAEVLIQDKGDNRLVNYRWRHTAISTLLMHGVDVATVAQLTGTSPDMIYKHYGHLLDSHLQVAAEKLFRRSKRPGSAPVPPAKT